MIKWHEAGKDMSTNEAIQSEKNIKALDYVVLHELLHLKHKKHNKDFVRDMDYYLPNWRMIRENLNEEILDYI